MRCCLGIDPTRASGSSTLIILGQGFPISQDGIVADPATLPCPVSSIRFLNALSCLLCTLSLIRLNDTPFVAVSGSRVWRRRTATARVLYTTRVPSRRGDRPRARGRRTNEFASVLYCIL